MTDTDEPDGQGELATADTDAAPEASGARAAADNDDVPTSADYSVAFSPRQVAVGLAIVAGLVAVLAARRRRRSDADEDA